MSGTRVDWAALNLDTVAVRRPGVAPQARPGVTPQTRRCDCILSYQVCHDQCPRIGTPSCVGRDAVVLDATRVIYRALKIHHTTARMAALALYHAGLLK